MRPGTFEILIIAALLGLIPATIAKRKGHSFGLWWLYGWALFIVAVIHVQFIPDFNAAAQNNTEQLRAGAADELMKYKDLLDSGVITAEEFEQKKKQLLNL